MGNCDAAESKPKEITFENPTNKRSQRYSLQPNLNTSLSNSRVDNPMFKRNSIYDSKDRITRKKKSVSRENGQIKETSRPRSRLNQNSKVKTEIKKETKSPKREKTPDLQSSLRNERGNFHYGENQLQRAPTQAFSIYQNGLQQGNQIYQRPITPTSRSVSPTIVRNLSGNRIVPNHNPILIRSFARDSPLRSSTQRPLIMGNTGFNGSYNGQNTNIQSVFPQNQINSNLGNSYPSPLNSYTNYQPSYSPVRNPQNYSPIRTNNRYPDVQSYVNPKMKPFNMNDYLNNISNLSPNKSYQTRPLSQNIQKVKTPSGIQKVTTNFQNEKYILTLKCTGDINKDAQVLQDILKVIPTDVNPQINEKEKLLTFTLQKADFENNTILKSLLEKLETAPDNERENLEVTFNHENFERSQILTQPRSPLANSEILEENRKEIASPLRSQPNYMNPYVSEI